MKNFETILNVGEDAANYIKVENVSQIMVVEPEKIGEKKILIREQRLKSY